MTMQVTEFMLYYWAGVHIKVGGLHGLNEASGVEMKCMHQWSPTCSSDIRQLFRS